MAYISRRSVLRGAASFGAVAGAGVLGQIGRAAQAADTSGYKALVCIFLKGGLDAADTVIPRDAESFDALADLRGDLFRLYGVGRGSSTRDRANLLALETSRGFGGRQFGLPSNMPGIAQLYSEGCMAVMGSVGPLIEPTTRAQMDAGRANLPPQLFSHNDQQSMWMTQGLEGSRLGWGGQFADIVAPVSGPGRTFTAVTASRADAFLSAAQVRQYPARARGSVKLKIVEDRYRLGNGSDEARRILQEQFASSDGASSANMLMRDLARGNAATINDNAVFKEAIQTATRFSTPFPRSDIGGRLLTIANTISVRGVLGAGRQLFYADQGGYDTHDNQPSTLPLLQRNLDEAVFAFNAAMQQLGLDDQVTLFTASDFGRTTTTNGDGTDHGWAGHHFVVGGAVRGGEIYGDIPPYDLGLDSYTGARGRIIPTTSVDQYAASLGRWFGLTPSELRASLPNLGNFADVPDLFGFGSRL